MGVEAVTGVITGSGMAKLFPDGERKLVKTDEGAVEAFACSEGGVRFYVLPRHGSDHSVPPHRVNFKGNVRAMKMLGASEVIATSAVGSISGRLAVGELGLLGQFIDFSKRTLTFFEDRPVHTDITYPYDRVLRERLQRAAVELGIELVPDIVYVSVDGPRYETAAEIRMFGLLGGDVVGMTGAPEAILCRELGLRYASVVIATNLGAGLQERVSHDEVVRAMSRVKPRLRKLLLRAIAGGVKPRAAY